MERTNSEKFEKLIGELRSCRDCEEKFGFEPHPVVMGNFDAKIMHISQAPSISVHKTMKSFNDISGKILRHEWYHISDEVFYDPANFYITSVGHCYPGKLPKGGDRLPPKECAEKWLAREIELTDSELIIIVGGKAAEFFFPKEDFKSLVFSDRTIKGKPAYVLPHPSPRNRKWLMDNPEFLNKRVKEISAEIHRVLGL